MCDHMLLLLNNSVSLSLCVLIFFCLFLIWKHIVSDSFEFD